jgi:hypothetical protein
MTVVRFALLILGLATASWSVIARAAEPARTAAGRWEYRVLTREQILDLGNKDLAAGLNKLGNDSWELAGIDTVYIFKRPRDQDGRRAEDIKRLIPLLESEVALQQERVAWAERMVRKGFMTERQAEAERLRLKGAELNLARARGELLPVAPRSVEPAEKERKSDP